MVSIVSREKGTVAFVFGVLFFFGVGTAFSSTTCMRFLKISTVPRIAGLGEAVVAVPDATWAEANPAHLANIGGSLVTFSHTTWYEDISLETLTFGTSGGKHGFGASLIWLHTEPLQGYGVYGKPTGTFRFYDLVVSASYARAFRPWLTAGVSGKALYEKIDWDSATGFALDLGLGCAPVRRLMGGRISAGLAIRNLGSKMGYFEGEFELPLTLQGGVSYQPGWLPRYMSALVSVDYEKTRDHDGGLLAGLEVGLANTLTVRAGYRAAYDNGDLALGFGLGLAGALVDYTYMDLGEQLGGTHRISLAFRAGEVFPSPEASR